ncbi:RNA polymerase recycling motor ATPase HelR [Herbiconiux daphne]|uniref:AAA family ATPase n=1 Tax=Herbiconiux daphne TaxID=2970914 RepID=A0ABT2GZM1_9MICO|nr:RNA polymerase recycling motor ATPase HelR [Herbiconiux daphne]MCS5733400.1 AAA family ATPase [Herbiconiux daphne]
MTSITSVFDLPDRLAAKADPALIAGDEAHFARIRSSLESTVAELSARLDAERRATGGAGQQALDRDLEIHRVSARLRTLRRFGLDACLGRTVPQGDDEPLYIGRFGLTDGDGRRLLVDWRSPAAEPFFGATHGDPMGLVSRRRYRWTRGRISDYWDEVFTADGLEGRAALDDQSAFIASLGSSRSARMRDVLGTIQADQDAIIRAGSRGALVVDGGPGTGTTVVALHRTAYLLYADPRLDRRRGGVLFVGPSAGYLAYIDDVLPSLGEDGVQIATLRDLVVESAVAVGEADPDVAALKSTVELVTAIERAVAVYERPPDAALTVETPWGGIRVTRRDWAEAFDARDAATSHNDARDEVWQELLTILVDGYDEEGRDDGRDGEGHDEEGLDEEGPDEDGRDQGGRDEEVSPARLRSFLARDEELRAAFSRAWPVLDPEGVVADLWSNPDYLQQSAPGLTTRQVALLQRREPRAWTVADLPLLDAARGLVGDPQAVRRRRERESALAAEGEARARVVDDLIAADDSELLVMSMLRGQDAQNSLVDDAALPSIDPDLLQVPFAHVVVDEAQELSDAEWQMLLRRCPSRSFTIVGDRAQARQGFAESWRERLHRIGLDGVTVATLSINYRTPEEVMAEAEPVIRAAVPDANVPVSVRRSGVPVVQGLIGELEAIVSGWLQTHAEGIACVIRSEGGQSAEVGRRVLSGLGSRARGRLRLLTPESSKGLEFDLVVLVDPESFGDGVPGAVDRYVAMTRATEQIVVLTTPPVP